MKSGEGRRRKARIALTAACVILCMGFLAAAHEEEKTLIMQEAEEIPAGWQIQAVFPDWKGYTDDTLAMNSMISFYGYHGQGAVYVQPAKEVTGFSMYVNGIAVDTSGMTGGGTYLVDISGAAADGKNTVQISNIFPFDLKEAITVTVPYPEVLPGPVEESGISVQALDLISDLIEADIENGFTSAQLAVIRSGRLVYENAWGQTCTYNPDGTVKTDSRPVTPETMYDLASVTKMASVNFGLQKLVTDGRVQLDAHITDFLGARFGEDVEAPEDAAQLPSDLETVKKWKASLTIRDLLRHQGGFPDYAKYWWGSGDGNTREAAIAAVCSAPLTYEPGTDTRYSDLDYIVLGLVIEQVTGKDLNTWLKETFWDPMGLAHITYNPLENGFEPEDCAATELQGNTRGGLLKLPGFRTYTLQGEVHDEKAWYGMQGVSGHAGLFASASDLARLASVMLCGGYGGHRFFSRNVMDQFTAPKKEDAANWGLGWYRQGDDQRVWYFGTQAGPDTIGHQGWSGTLLMIDPQRQLVIAYLTNRINSPVTDPLKDADQFDGNWYTASTLGFVPQILSLGMDADMDISAQLLDLSADMFIESVKLIPEGIDLTGEHPAVRNARSKWAVFERTAERVKDEEREGMLRQQLEEMRAKRFGD